MAASLGRTSKIARYYWRELRFEAMKRFEVWSQSQGPGDRTPAEDAELKKKIKRDVLEELKSLHRLSIRSRRTGRVRSSTNTALKLCRLTVTFPRDDQFLTYFLTSLFSVKPPNTLIKGRWRSESDD